MPLTFGIFQSVITRSIEVLLAIWIASETPGAVKTVYPAAMRFRCNTSTVFGTSSTSKIDAFSLGDIIGPVSVYFVVGVHWKLDVEPGALAGSTLDANRSAMGRNDPVGHRQA